MTTQTGPDQAIHPQTAEKAPPRKSVVIMWRVILSVAFWFPVAAAAKQLGEDLSKPVVVVVTVVVAIAIGVALTWNDGKNAERG